MKEREHTPSLFDDLPDAPPREGASVPRVSQRRWTSLQPNFLLE